MPAPAPGNGLHGLFPHYQEGAAFIAPQRMLTVRRADFKRACWVCTGIVMQHAIEHENQFVARMKVALGTGTRLITYQGR